MKKTLSILLSILLAFSAFSVMPFSAFAAEEYDIWVGGTRVTSDNKNNIPAAEGYEQYSGTANYEPSTETLTLNNYIYKGTGEFLFDNDTRVGGVCSYTHNTLTIILKGNNSITVTGEDINGCSYGIYVGNGGVTFKGDGTLNVESADVDATRVLSNTVAVSVASGINVEGGTINALAKKGSTSFGFSAASVNISGGKVTAVAGEASKKSAGMRAANSISVGANAEYIEASGNSGAVSDYWDKITVSTQLTGMGWTDTAGTEGLGIIATGDYNSNDLSGYKKVVFPAVPDGQMGDNVYYKVVGKTAYVYGTGDMWDYDDDANTSPFYEDCLGVNEIVIMEGITGIGDYAFFAISIVSVSFPSTLKTIGDYAFSTTNLTAILIPEGVTDIGQYAFENTYNAELIFIPSTVTTIPKEAFSGAYHFTALILDRSLEFIAYNAFNGCNNLTDIYFYGCSSLNGPNFNSDDGNEPIYNATWHYIQEGEFGEHILLLSNSSVGDVDSVATVMVPGDKRGEKVHLTVVNGNIFDGDVDITKYSSALNYSSAVVDLGRLHPGSYDATASYTDENNNKYTVSGQIDAGKWSPHLDVKDVNIFLGQTAVIEANLDEDATGNFIFTIDGDSYTRYPREGKATLSIDGFPAGEYPIEVEFSGDDNYLSETVTAKLFVSKKLNIVTPKTATITYGNAAPTEVEISYTDADGNVLAGLPEKLPCTSSYTQYGNVGKYTISLDADKIEQQGIFDAYEQAGYGFSEFDFTATSTLTVNQKPLFVTWNNVTEFTYDGKQKTIGGAVSGFELADLGKVNVSFQNNSKVDAGTYTAQIVLTGDKAGNYSINDADKSKQWSIKKAELTVTANQQELTYNGAIQGPGDATYADAAELAEVITVSGLKGDDKVTSVIIDGQGKNADTYDLVPKSATVNGKNEAQGNYNITYVNGVLKINPKPLNITVFGQETYARYNGTEQSYTGTVLCTADPEFDFSKFSYTGNTTVKGTNAGDYEIYPSISNCTYSDSNYKINWSVGSPIRLTITQCALDITADSKETNHGSDLASLTYTIKNYNSCYYNEDELNISISTNADKNKPGTYDITVSCEDNPNYAVRTFSGTYTVGDSPHTWSDVTYEWTGTSSVTASRKCIYCDETEAETVATSSKETKAPTCTENGETTYTATFTNSVFETQTRIEADVAAPGHDYTETVTPPTCTEQGYTTFTCKHGDDEYIADYVAASGHKYAADDEARYTCTLCGAVDETLKKACAEKDKAEFTASVSTTPEDDGATVAWKKAPEAKRYVIYAAYCGKKNKYRKIKTVKGNITSFRLKKLGGRKINTKKNLKVYIVAQKKVNGKWVKLFRTPTFHTAGKNSKYTNVKKIKVKKARFSLEQGKTAKIEAKLVLVNKKKKPIHHVKTFRYMSTDTAVVKVTKNGKIKAKKKGKVTIYIFANNGTTKKVKVTVK